MATLRIRPVSRVGLMLSAFFNRCLGFLGGLVPRPLVEEELELEAVDLKRDRPRTMAGEVRRVPWGRPRVCGYAVRKLGAPGAVSQHWRWLGDCGARANDGAPLETVVG